MHFKFNLTRQWRKSIQQENINVKALVNRNTCNFYKVVNWNILGPLPIYPPTRNVGKTFWELNSDNTLGRLFLWSLKRSPLIFSAMTRFHWFSEESQEVTVLCQFSLTRYRASRRATMYCPRSACSAAQLGNKISPQCKFRASRQREGTMHHSTDVALNSVRSATHDVNMSCATLLKMSFQQRIKHNDVEVLCLNEDPRRVLRKLLSFVSRDVLWMRFAWITSSLSMS